MKRLKNFSTISAELIIDELIKQDITQFYISPGKRNLPLINALTHQSSAKIHTCIDERSAAFMAMGFVHKSHSPAVLICTSGSALAHYSPAILEALHSNHSLLIISADRPISLVHGHANQSINQYNFFNLPNNQFYNFELHSEQSSPNSVKRVIAHISNQIRTIDSPIHINIPFSEPLDYSQQKISPSYLKQTISLLMSKKPYTTYIQNTAHLKTLVSNKTTAVVVGALEKNRPRGLAPFLKNISSQLFCDITSMQDCKYNSFHPDHKSFAQMLATKKITNIVHIGGRVTSNKYYTLLHKFNVSVMHITNDSEVLQDPSFQVYSVVNTKKMPSITAYSKPQAYESKALTNLSHYTAAKLLWDVLPVIENLLIGNSMIIRAFDLLSKARRHSALFFQRGTSGIDGNLSHAIGIAQASKIKTHVVTGDLAFFHDIGSLFNLYKDKINLTIYIINNSQGGIFNLLSLKDSTQAQNIIAHSHTQQLEPLAKSFNIPFQCVTTTKELETLIKCLGKKSGINLVEMKVDQKTSQKHFKQLVSQ